MKLKKRRVAELLGQLEQIENEAKALEKKYEKRLKKIHPANQKSALNLIHYLALRNQDIRGFTGHSRAARHIASWQGGKPRYGKYSRGKKSSK